MSIGRLTGQPQSAGLSLSDRSRAVGIIEAYDASGRAPIAPSDLRIAPCPLRSAYPSDSSTPAPTLMPTAMGTIVLRDRVVTKVVR